MFPRSTPEILPESREKQATRDGSGPIRNPQPDPLSAPESRSRPGNWPALHTPGPWAYGGSIGTFHRVIGPEGSYRGDGLDHVCNAFCEGNARLIAATPQLLDSLLAVEWGGVFLNDDADEIDCCPNCFAPHGRFHYAHCELRDSLDAALGVTSERVVHPAHAKEAAHG